MGDNTAIEWTDATWTPIRATWFAPQSDGSGKERIGWHCERVSEACRNCYAEGINLRLGTGLEFKPGHLRHTNRFGEQIGDVRIFLDDRLLVKPLHWRRPRHIFVCSMTDLFGSFVEDAMIAHCFAIMALASWHTFQVLTKRPDRAKALLTDPAFWLLVKYLMHRMAADGVVKARPIGELPFALPNVWLGVSAEGQPQWDERTPYLRQMPAVVRFVSVEPLLGEIKADMRGLDWIIAGGESGLGARPMNPWWVRSLRDQCQATGVPFFFKQWGDWIPEELVADAAVTYQADLKAGRTWRFSATPMRRRNKKSNGATLDDREWREMPR